VTPTGRNAANTEESAPFVAAGLAFDKNRDNLFIADLARGAIWKATFDHAGNLKSKTGCDTTLNPNTLCLTTSLSRIPILLAQTESHWIEMEIYGSLPLNAKPSWL
jgi:hypothetical protein